MYLSFIQYKYIFKRKIIKILEIVCILEVTNIGSSFQDLELVWTKAMIRIANKSIRGTSFMLDGCESIIFLSSKLYRVP